MVVEPRTGRLLLARRLVASRGAPTVDMLLIITCSSNELCFHQTLVFLARTSFGNGFFSFLFKLLCFCTLDSRWMDIVR